MRLFISLIYLLISISAFSQKDIKMVLLNGGTFEMGSNNEAYPDENPRHRVHVDAFYIAQYEITYEDYQAFCKTAGFSDPYGTPGFPASNITWERAVMMCNWLSKRDGYDKAYTIKHDDKSGVFEVQCNFKSNGYRLPTEAEWEYAARGGERSKSYVFCGSNMPYSVAWFSENYKGEEHKSGELLPNEAGLYDMCGNVAEWCWDYYSENYYTKAASTNPSGPDAGENRVLRGGTRRDKMKYIAFTRRSFLNQKMKNIYSGFRPVRTKTEE